MCSWSMVNNEDNWLPWQIKDWFNKKIKKSPKSAQSLTLVKFQVHSPQRVNYKLYVSGGPLTMKLYVSGGPLTMKFGHSVAVSVCNGSLSVE